MSITRVGVASLGSYVTGLTEERFKEVVKAVRTQCRTLGLALIQEEVTNARAVDRGVYRRGWRYRSLDDGAELVNTAAHSANVEAGRRKGARMPPVESIQGWVHRKGLVAKGRNRKGRELSMAWAVARAIAKRGIKGRWILKTAMKRFRRPLREAIRAAAAGQGK